MDAIQRYKSLQEEIDSKKKEVEQSYASSIKEARKNLGIFCKEGLREFLESGTDGYIQGTFYIGSRKSETSYYLFCRPPRLLLIDQRRGHISNENLGEFSVTPRQIPFQNYAIDGLLYFAKCLQENLQELRISS